jgi:hypothetical protein
MKHLLIVAMLMVAGTGWAETLTRVDKMSDAEISRRRAAIAEVNKAQEAVASINQEIATAHGMKAEDWMEWSSRVTFEGDYIFLYRSNHMEMMRLLK